MTKAVSPSKLKTLSLVVIVAILSLGLEGCMYRILWHDASKEKDQSRGECTRALRRSRRYQLLNPYGMQQFDRVTDYQVPADGRVVVAIPAYRHV
jgi:hypothetical protein